MFSAMLSKWNSHFEWLFLGLCLSNCGQTIEEYELYEATGEFPCLQLVNSIAELIVFDMSLVTLNTRSRPLAQLFVRTCRRLELTPEVRANGV